MKKEEVLKAFRELSAEDQQAVREGISERAAASCCNADEMKEHMGAMMRMMHATENPMEHCKEMMEMCQKMMNEKASSTRETASARP